MSGGPPSSPSRWQPFLLLAITLLGVPTALLAFIRTINPDPRFQIATLIIYAVLFCIVSVVNKIWQRLEEPWLEQIANWIRIRVQWMIFRPGSKYRQYMHYQHRDLDVKGFSTQGSFNLALDKVFVELSMVPTAPHQAPTNPIQEPSPWITGEHPIWDYLSSRVLNEQHFVIIGPPGSGKTTLLKHMVLTLLYRSKHTRRVKVPRKLPILLFLREHAESIAESIKMQTGFFLEDAVEGQFKKWQKQALPSGWLQRQLEKGDCLVFLDGLDEVADVEKRKQVANWVQQQMNVYGRDRFLITSRPFGYRASPLNGVTVLKVNAFTPKQIEQFVHNWYLENEVMRSQKDDFGVRRKAQHGAEDFLKRLRAMPALFDLAVNPLLLTMIATVHRYRDTLPGKRVTLYAEICEVFLGKRQEAKGIQLELTVAQQRLVLQPLAYYMMDKKIRDIPLNEACQMIEEALTLVSTKLSPKIFLQLVENTSGLLLEREQGIYSFAHLTFQEYLAAIYIKEKKEEKVLVDHITESWWHETIRLYCAVEDASAIIVACLVANPLTVAALTLALECQEEALKIQQPVRLQLEMFLAQRKEDPDPERRKLVAEALLAQRLRQMVHLRDDISVDTTLITNAEYQLFLDEQREQGNIFRPDHWQSSSFPKGQADIPILGVRYSDAIAFCAWLTKHGSGLWHYRLPREDELKELRVVITVASDMGYWVEGHNFSRKKVPSISDQVRQSMLGSHIVDRLVRDPLARDRALARAHALDRIYSRNLAYVLGIAFACAFDLDAARAFDLSLDGTLDLDRTLSSDGALDLDRVFDLARTRALARDLARDLDSTRARTLDSTRTLDSARIPDHTHALDHTRMPDIARMPDHAHARMPDIARPLDRVNASGFTGKPNFADTPDFTSMPILYRTLDLDLGLAHALDLGLDRTFVDTLNLETAEFLRWYIRFSTYILTYAYHYLSYRHSKDPLFTVLGSWKQDNLERMIESSLDLYVMIALLEERIQGRLPAWEGILLVRESRKDTQ